MSAFVLDITYLGFLHKEKSSLSTLRLFDIVFFSTCLYYLRMCSRLWRKSGNLLGYLNSLSSSVKFYNTFPVTTLLSNFLFHQLLKGIKILRVTFTNDYNCILQTGYKNFLVCQLLIITIWAKRCSVRRLGGPSCCLYIK